MINYLRTLLYFYTMSAIGLYTIFTISTRWYTAPLLIPVYLLLALVLIVRIPFIAYTHRNNPLIKDMRSPIGVSS